MGIYNRNYMQPERGYAGFDALKGLLITLGVVFVLQAVLTHWVRMPLLTEFGALSLSNLMRGFVWTPITYGFLHDPTSLWHILFNGVGLYFIGRYVQGVLGSVRLLEIFFFTVLMGAALFIVTRLFAFPQVPVIGASAAVLGMLTILCLMLWDEEIRMIFPPIAIKAKYILYFTLVLEGFNFLFNELPGTSLTADSASAHVGGMLGGFLYHRYLMNRPTLTSIVQGVKPAAASVPQFGQQFGKTKASNRPKPAKTGKYKVNLSKGTPKDVRQEVDRILDKINTQGFGSLTEEEKRTLDRAKDALK
ncbi:MAG: rhomboid family intramembrane serine protease [Verrucomicrobiota bacterium JB022]|nr:rhomboid family intramembrane serine protease [Verrucomicrobiota bacterium JB022]